MFAPKSQNNVKIFLYMDFSRKKLPEGAHWNFRHFSGAIADIWYRKPRQFFV